MVPGTVQEHRLLVKEIGVNKEELMSSVATERKVVMTISGPDGSICRIFEPIPYHGCITKKYHASVKMAIKSFMKNYIWR